MLTNTSVPTAAKPISQIDELILGLDKSLSGLHESIHSIEGSLIAVVSPVEPVGEQAPTLNAPITCALSERLHSVQVSITNARRHIDSINSRLCL